MTLGSSWMTQKNHPLPQPQGPQLDWVAHLKHRRFLLGLVNHVGLNSVFAVVRDGGTFMPMSGSAALAAPNRSSAEFVMLAEEEVNLMDAPCGSWRLPTC